MTATAAPIKSFPLANATPSQKQVMQLVTGFRTQRNFIWWSGGVRAGKSFGSAMAFLEHQRDRKGKRYLVLAFTVTQAIEIYGPYFQAIGEAMGYTMKLVRGANSRIEVAETSNVFLLKGADKEGKDKSIQGLTMEGLLADEVVLLNRSALHQAEARVSGEGALRIYTSNKQSRYHWTYKYYVQRIERKEIAGMVIDCDLQDNHHVNADYQAERASEFTGNTLRRFIDNEFTLDGDPVFDAKVGHCPLDGRRETYLGIYGHAKGYEAVSATVIHGKSVHLQLWKAFSFRRYQEIQPLLIDRPRCLVNSEQLITARWLRRKGYPVKGYQEDVRGARVEVLKRMCAEERVWLNPDDDALMEAVKTYYNPKSMDFPVVLAIEALGEVLRSYVSLD